MMRLWSMLAAGTLAATWGWAQLTRGSISGIVQDSTGASVSGTTVRITNLSTNLEDGTVTNDDGIYRFPAVEPGEYRIEFSKPGFEDSRVLRVAVTTTHETVINQALAVAGVVTSVTVDTPVGTSLSKASASIDMALAGSTTENMPLRDASFLARLAPMTVRGVGGVVSSAGHANFRNYFAVDGLDHGSVANPLLPPNRLLPESVGEFHVQSYEYSAEFGHNYGAQISAITRSGTNQLHAEAWEYFQSSFLNSRSLPDKNNGIFSDRYVEHDAGGSIGGPVHKDRTFVFGLVSTDRQRTGPTTRRAASLNIPTPEGYASLAGIPLASGQTAESRQAALSALNFLRDVYPQIKVFQPATRPVTVNGVNVPMATVRVPYAVVETFWDWRGRLDHRLTSKDTLNFTTQGTSDVTPVNSSCGGNCVTFGPLFADSRKSFAAGAALSHTRTVSPHWVNEARFGFTSYRNRQEGQSEAALVNLTDFSFGRISVSGGQQEERVYEWQDVTSHLAGRHAIKLGADIAVRDFYDPAVSNSRGTWQFSGLALFLNSQPTSYTQTAESQAFDSRHLLQAYFAQDDFRVRPTLTITLGVRYELRNAPHGYFGAGTPDVAAVGVPGPVEPDRNNIAPRAGLAWSPNPKGRMVRRIVGAGRTVFRGGFGIAYDWFGDAIAGGVGNTNYPRARSFQIDLSEATNLYPNVVVKPAKGLDPAATFVNLPQYAQLPTVNFYSFAIQRQIAKDYIVELGYAGNRDYHVGNRVERNPAVLTQAQANSVIAAGVLTVIPGAQQRRLHPAWGSRVVYETSFLGRYNALYARFDKHLSCGFLLGATYTYSSALTNASPPQQFFDYRLETGRSTNDRPHRAVIHFVYESPAPRAGWRMLFGGWRLAGFSEWQSGQPFSVTTGVDSTGVGPSTAGASSRPDYSPSGIIALDTVTGNMRSFQTPINGSGIFVTPLGRDGRPLANSMPSGGNLGKNTFRGPGLSLWNLDLARAFPIRERLRLEFRADAENLFNHRNFLPPDASMNSLTFGSNRSDPGIRNVRLSLKLRF
jgi:carboxypeptidase family protein